MEKFSLAKFLGITEEELLITSARNTKRNNEEEAKRKVDIARLKDLSPEELRLMKSPRPRGSGFPVIKPASAG